MGRKMGGWVGWLGRGEAGGGSVCFGVEWVGGWVGGETYLWTDAAALHFSEELTHFGRALYLEVGGWVDRGRKGGLNKVLWG